jgi:hypothetical protein
MKTRSEIAESRRWRGIVGFIQNWIGPFGNSQGMEPAELNAILQARGLSLSEAIQEWCILAANWNQGGINVWIPPSRLVENEGSITVLSDTEGITYWQVACADMHEDDPPVLNGRYPAFPRFSECVAAMVINDYLFAHDETDEPIQLRKEACSALSTLGSSQMGLDFYTDGPLESATVVAFAYPDQVLAKARTPAGAAWLERLRK